ncbi:DUF748 domain-containing protein [Pelobacter seleniigenes]|uniref:DUF748 domain-containing protein n=1 Tax=Pelobacter seleniigenes TaxID=407188 RepID=UPI0004A6C9CE|nr:DUF748 domain-containing protein [Pelobacter seleniigenes]
MSSRWLKRSLVVAGVILLLMLLSMLIVPWQVKKQGQAWIAENTKRTLTLEKVFFNPFTLTLELSGAKLTEPNSSQPFVSFSKLVVSASIRSLPELALILDHVELDDPYVNIELLAPGQFNFADFLQSTGDTAETTPQSPPSTFHFSLNNIRVKNGAVDFSDLASANHSHHQIRQLLLTVPSIGNIPYMMDDFVQPELSLLLNGSELAVNGRMKPFHNSLETNLFFTIHAVDLPFYASHLPVTLPLEVAQGTLDFQLDLAYRISRSEEPKLMLGGEFAVSDLDLREPDGKPLFSLGTLLVSLGWADVFKQDFNLSSIELYEPQLSISRNPAGQWNLVELFSPSADSAAPGAEPPPKTSEPSKLPLVLIENTRIHEGQIHFRDESVATPVNENLRHLNLTLDNLSTHPEELADLNLSLLTDRELSLSVAGTLGIAPLSAQLDLIANGLPLQPYYPYLQPVLTEAIQGRANFAGQLRYTADGNVQLLQTQLTLRDLLIPFGGEDRFSLAEFHMNGSSFDLNRRQVNLGAIGLDKGRIKATRLADGTLTPLRILRAPEHAEPAPPPAAAQETPAASPWTVQLDSLDLAHFNIEFQDQALDRKPTLNLTELHFHSENIHYPEAQKSPFQLATKVGNRGHISVGGSAVHTPLQVKANSRIQGLALADFNNFIPAGLNLRLTSGQLNSNLALTLTQQNEELLGNFAGNLNVTGFSLRDPLSDGKLLTWDTLNLAGIDGTLAPFALHIKDVALSNYLANIEITPDGQVNLTSVTAESPAGAPAAADQPPKPQPSNSSAATSAGPVPDIRIDALTLQGGTVSFTDRHLPSTFATTMYQLGGRVSGMSSDQQMQADVDLRGQLENHSPLTVSGKINPLSKNLFADLTIRFEDIDLSPLTPYSGTYLGYAIAKGKLYLDLNYHIEHQQISADNRVMIDQFTFGDTVQSKQATSLPVALAISLLKDRNDEIHLNIPISGNLNDPDFSLFGTVFTVLRNLLVKAATSPFSLLASMLGGNEDFSSIEFPLGTAIITEEQNRKLQELADVLINRPGLILEVSGFADKDKDPEAYRKNHLKQLLLDLKWRQLTEQGTPAIPRDELQISPEEYPELLKTVYQEADFPRPRNIVGMLKDLPPEEMEKLLLANIRADNEELAALARHRALAVQDALIKLDEALKPRIFLKEADIFQSPKSGPASRVEFGISTK